MARAALAISSLTLAASHAPAPSLRGVTQNATAARALEQGCEYAQSVQCPFSSTMCAGDQCCPRAAETGGKTYPCPSASDSVLCGCEMWTKPAGTSCLSRGHQTLPMGATCPTPAPPSSAKAAEGDWCGLDWGSFGEGPGYGECAAGLVCALPPGELDAQTICQVAVAIGDPCGFDYFGNNLGACDEGLACASPQGRPSEHPICRILVAEGERCGVDYYGNDQGVCEYWLACGSPAGRPSEAPICQPPGANSKNTYCGGAYGNCEIGLKCAAPADQPEAQSICQGVSGLGESCGLNYKGDRLGLCADGLVCSIPQNGVCQFM